jgi:hypothetical protein
MAATAFAGMERWLPDSLAERIAPALRACNSVNLKGFIAIPYTILIVAI